ncbi:leucine Rich repeat-containing domain protein [gut metagenome]|uniref:Leucine Rich repeat-containing domain protein n=1 Tax=gut metagenome TaxID=749906 RepID=J9DCG2_9ZZZZ
MTTSCSDDDDEVSAANFSLSQKEVATNAEGGKENVTVTSDVEWVAKTSEPWLNISPASGTGSTECVITIDAALKNEVRNAEICFIPKGQNPDTIRVTQLGYDKMIYVKKTEVKLKASEPYEKRFFVAEITTNVPFEVQTEYLTEKDDVLLSDWIRLERKNKPSFNLESARPQTLKIRFEWDMNPEWIQREAKINFVPTQESDKEAKITPIKVIQEASPVITDDRSGDSLAILTIRERLHSEVAIDPSENMNYWECISLWERTDKNLPCQEAIGRVRSLNFTMLKIKESIPQEVKYLKYLETFKVYGNENTMLLDIKLGSELCELKYLKHLQIGGYGLSGLPDDFGRLKTLESLDLSANNFTEIPAVLNQNNFPNLKKLVFNGNRRWTISNLQDTKYNKDTEIGLHMNLNQTPNEINPLFLWENLEELILSYNYLEGTLPEYEDMPAYTDADLEKYFGEHATDTLSYLVENNIPKIMPNMKHLTLNLNFLTGPMPKWLLYHPHFLDWFPEILIFNQQENAFDSKGVPVKFSNQPINFDYYFEAFPLYRDKYEMNGDAESELPEAL